MGTEAISDEGDDSTHEFGAAHTALKLETLRKYLPAYTRALQSRFYLHYIDAFAGTGMCNVTVGGEQIEIPGSASIAITCAPPFHRMVFIEKSTKRVRALERLKDRAKDRDIAIVKDDANVAVPAHLRALNASRDRAIVFLDPYGMQVRWETLREIAASKIADLWYLFPLSGLYRQASLRADDIDEDKAAALTRILGTEEWRTAFYGRPATHSSICSTSSRSCSTRSENQASKARRSSRCFSQYQTLRTPHARWRCVSPRAFSSSCVR